jgi:predicted small secreted protein
MENLKRTMLIVFAWLMFLSVSVTMSGCGTTSQVRSYGRDVAYLYCEATSDEFKAVVKARLNRRGIEVGVDFCTVRGLVEVVRNDGA